MGFSGKEIKLIVICAAVGMAFGLFGAFVYGNFSQGDNAKIKEFYATENIVSVSPSDVLRHLQDGKTDWLIVDLRAKEAYQAGHFATAVNIPAESMTADQLVAAFSSLPPGKTYITYCYSSYCMLSRNVGGALADRGVYVKHMTAGWYELNRDYGNYIVSGLGPGAFKPAGAPAICGVGNSSGFGC